MREIVSRENLILRNNAKDVPLEDIKSEKIQKILADMRSAVETQHDGVAIAAPQIGESLRIFLVSEKVLDNYKQKTGKKINLDKLVFINPEIIYASKKKQYMEEGCLSVRYLYGKVRRSVKVTIRAYDENGIFFERTESGLVAQIFQHEVDHLNGILFIDTATDVIDLPPKKI